jgi:hypothetical protein
LESEALPGKTKQADSPEIFLVAKKLDRFFSFRWRDRGPRAIEL